MAFNHQYRTARTYQATNEWPPSCTTCGQYGFGIHPVSGPPYTSGLNPTQIQFNATHATLIPVGPYRGQVLVWEGDANYGLTIPGRFIPGVTRYSILDPTQDPSAVTGVMFRNFYLDLIESGTNLGTLFCTGGVWTQEGLFFVSGGSHPDSVTPPYNWPQGGAKAVAVFDPGAFDIRTWVQDYGTWWLASSGQRLDKFRWYPTQLHLSQGSRRVLTLGGQEKQTAGFQQQNYEAYVVPGASSATFETWPGPNPRRFDGPTATRFPQFWNFPRFHLLTSGLAFLSATQRDPGCARPLHTPNANATWTEFGTNGTPLNAGWTSSVLLPNLGGLFNRVMRIARVDSGGGSVSVEVANANYATVTWSPLSGSGAWPQLRTPRDHPNAVLLPDASVLVVTGELPPATPPPPPDDWARPELLRLRDLGAPDFGWIYGAAHVAFGGARGYHSFALLLPDARVLVGGGEARTKDYAIFRPYYLDLGPRPTITAAPTVLRYPPAGQSYSFITDNQGFGLGSEKIVLVRPGMATHHSDMEQRYLELQTLASNELVNGLELVVAPPASENHAPPGYYMAFAVTGLGVPSVAAWVQVTP